MYLLFRRYDFNNHWSKEAQCSIWPRYCIEKIRVLLLKRKIHYIITLDSIFAQKDSAWRWCKESNKKSVRALLGNFKWKVDFILCCLIAANNKNKLEASVSVRIRAGKCGWVATAHRLHVHLGSSQRKTGPQQVSMHTGYFAMKTIAIPWSLKLYT